jgi:hypothetical protein
MNNPDIFKGTTVNERLYLSGMMVEFDRAIKNNNRNTAYRILRELKVDEPSIISIVGYTNENLQYPNAWDFPNENSNGLNNDEKAILEYSDLNEIGMGAPLRGICRIKSNKNKSILIDNNCGGPAIWTKNGLKIAIPIWEKSFFSGTFQRIGIVDLKNQTLTKYKKKFRVLDLKSFSGNLIFGIDSPIHKMKTIEFNYENEPIEKVVGIK